MRASKRGRVGFPRVLDAELGTWAATETKRSGFKSSERRESAARRAVQDNFCLTAALHDAESLHCWTAGAPTKSIPCISSPRQHIIATRFPPVP